MRLKLSPQLRQRLGKIARAIDVYWVRYIRVPYICFGSGLGQGAWILHGLVHTLKPDVCVEIGSARGLSACYIGLALKQLGAGKLYAIDPHTRTDWNDVDAIDTYKTMRRNLRRFRVQRYVEIVRAYSNDAAQDWNRPIDLLFIDGDHSYEGVKHDWERFTPHMSEFGVVVFHDTMWDRQPDAEIDTGNMGVPRFMDELRQEGFPVITLPEYRGISLVQPRKGGIPLSRQGQGAR